MAVLQNYEGSNDDFVNVGTGQNIGQQFQLQADSTITSMSLFGGKGTVGTQPGTMKIELMSGSYTGTVIATVTTFSTTVMSDWTPTAAWYEFTFATPVAVLANTNYWVKATGVSGSTNDVFRWANDNTSPTYSLGTTWFNDAIVSANDCNFRINGTAGGASATPNLPMLGVGS